MKKLVLLLLALVFAMGACVALAEEPTIYTSGNYEYILLDDGTAEITKYNGSKESVSIPANLDGHVVTSIGDKAFYYCRALTSITIPDSVTTIGDSAFYNCNALTSVTIPDSVTSIGEGAFVGCDSLTSINVSAEHPTFASIDGVLFEKATKTLVCYPCGINAGSYSIPDSVTTIGDWAFSYCDALTSITIPDSVTTIGKGAFVDCDFLTSINVSAENPTFASINGVLFEKASNTLVCYPCGIKADSYFIPDSVTSIGDYAFSCCSALASITIPDSVTSIGNWAFADCEALTSITIPDSVTTIGKDAFSDCPNLTLTVSRDSFALQYCKDNSLNYTYPDALNWLNN